MVYTDKIVTTNLIFKLREDGIIEMSPLPGWEGVGNIHRAKENMAAVQKISRGSLKPLLTYLPDFEVDNESQRFFAGHEQFAIAIAMVSTSMMQTLLGNLLLNVRRMKTPSKMFVNDSQAVIWLKEKQKAFDSISHFRSA